MEHLAAFGIALAGFLLALLLSPFIPYGGTAGLI